MKERKKLQPKQVMFLKYLLTHGTYLKPITISRIEFSLKMGKYIIHGPNAQLFNRLRNKHMYDFEMFEANYNNTK